MADNVTLNSMSGGSVVATDDSGTGHVQIVKLAYSADGDRTHVDADANGLKVSAGSVVPGTSATSLGKAEDAAHSSGDTGVAVWGVRNDSLSTTFTSGNGDYSPFAVNSGGAVYVVASSAGLAVNDNGGSLTVDGSVSITGTPSVSVSNTPAVSQSGSWTVSIGNNPTVNVSGAVPLGSPITSYIPIAAENPSGQAASLKVNPSGALTVVGPTTAGSAITDVVPVAGRDSAGNALEVSVDGDGGVIAGYGTSTVMGKYISTGSSAPPDEMTFTSVPSTLIAMYVSNTGTNVAYVKVWDTTSGAIGTTAPNFTFAVPPSTTQTIDFPSGAHFMFGIWVGFTAGPGDYDTTTVGADEVIANVLYIE